MSLGPSRDRTNEPPIPDRSTSAHAACESTATMLNGLGAPEGGRPGTGADPPTQQAEARLCQSIGRSALVRIHRPERASGSDPEAGAARRVSWDRSEPEIRLRATRLPPNGRLAAVLESPLVRSERGQAPCSYARPSPRSLLGQSSGSRYETAAFRLRGGSGSVQDQRTWF